MLYKTATTFFAFALVALGACQPLERPFQPTQKASYKAAPGPRASLYVAEIENGPDKLREDVAKKLQDLGIAAFTGEVVANRYSVQSDISLEDNSAYVNWRILDPFGRDTGLSSKQKLGDIYEGPGIFGHSLEEATNRSASEIDVMLGGSGINFETLKKPTIFVPIVQGAPGDGSETLAAAMQDQITDLGIEVMPELWQAGYILKGEVSLTPPTSGTQVVTILWQLERQNGEYVGKIEQKNRIRAGTLNGPWGPVAKAAARGGAQGILKLLRQVEESYFKQKRG